MDHHVLHIPLAQRTPVVADLASAPGRMVVFTRTKSRAKALTKQLNAQGIPAVELHGNLAQNARARNMKLFQSGEVQTLVATDIAARGIHVDDIELVVHADPPVEHKAYLHRSGRTARAGKAGTVVTLMTDDQARDVRSLTKAAGVRPTTTRVDTVANPILAQLAPGQRRRSSPTAIATAPVAVPRSPATSRGGRRGPSAPRTADRSKPAAERNGGAPRRNRTSATASASAVGRGHSAARFSSRSRRG
jgi:superfamily II DNA/RNA helicase